MSFSFILVAGAGLLLKSLQAMQAAAAGFATDGLLYGNVDWSQPATPGSASAISRID